MLPDLCTGIIFGLFKTDPPPQKSFILSPFCMFDTQVLLLPTAKKIFPS